MIRHSASLTWDEADFTWESDEGEQTWDGTELMTRQAAP